MHISYGPPGRSGVSQLMHVGDLEILGVSIDQRIVDNARTGALVSAGVWAYASFTGRDSLRLLGAIGAIGLGAIWAIAQKQG